MDGHWETKDGDGDEDASQKAEEVKYPQDNTNEAPMSSSTCLIHFYILLTPHFTEDVASAPEEENTPDMSPFQKITLAKRRNIPHDPYISLLQYPVYYFFYGSMADPATLKRTLNLDEAPKLHEAYIVGYTVARKNDLPALVDGLRGEVVKGYAYFVGSEAEGEKLRECHPKQCRVATCLVHFRNGNKVTKISGNVLKHVGDAEAFLEPVDTQDWVHVSMESLGDS